MTRPISGMICVAAALVLPCGCTKPPPQVVAVSGLVTSNGQPLPYAEVRFYPKDEHLGGEYIGIGVTDDKGHYTITTSGQPGACTGVHKVTVSEGPPPAGSRGRSDRATGIMSDYQSKLVNRPIPAKYGNVAETPLELTITPDKSDYDIALTP